MLQPLSSYPYVFVHPNVSWLLTESPQRPDIVAPLLYVDINEVDQAAPGYIFFTPNSPGKANFKYGPYAYNNEGVSQKNFIAGSCTDPP